MKKLGIVLTLILAFVGFSQSAKAEAYNFGDFRSETLTTKAWQALNEGDIEAVLAYTNKNIELYAEQAKKMQSDLKDYPSSSKEEIFSYWALNDVGTSLFIQGEAYRRAKMLDEAKGAFQKVIDEYSYAQAWDPNGWFWKPADASKEKLQIIESGSDVDFGDYTSSYITTKAWKALMDHDLQAVLTYTNKIVELYGTQAKEMQNSLTEYPWQSKDKIFSYWALNDVGTSLFIQAEAYREEGQMDKAKEAYKKVIEDYFYAQCWDPKGWFWKPAEAAQEKLDGLEEI